MMLILTAMKMILTAMRTIEIMWENITKEDHFMFKLSPEIRAALLALRR